MKNKNRRGFTIIELVFTIAVSAVIIYSSIFVPTQTIKKYREIDKNLERSLYMLTMNKSILNDTVIGSGSVKYNDMNTHTYIEIGENKYLFSDNGIRRNNTRLTKNVFQYKIDEDMLEITGNIFNDKIINLKYNMRFSSFKTEGDYYD